MEYTKTRFSALIAIANLLFIGLSGCSDSIDPTLPAAAAATPTPTPQVGFFGFYKFTEGANPRGDLLLSGGTLYGTTVNGGTSNNGTVFSIAASGGTKTILYSFSATDGGGHNTDGANPQGSLILSGGILYGTAANGGTSSFGTVFGIPIAGSGSTLPALYNFGGNEGANPQGSLILSVGILYGTAVQGGTGYGTLFGIPVAGSADVVPALYTFSATDDSGNNTDGATPQGSLLLSDGILYGTARGGANGNGVIFGIPVGGSGATVPALYSFSSSGATDGQNSVGSLILSGGILYGTTQQGGANGNGAIFGIPVAGSGSTVPALYSFGSLSNQADGSTPYGSLILSGGILYGTTQQGGANNYGTVFGIPVAGSGTGVTPLYDFGSLASQSDGAYPMGSLILSGGALYGTTSSGGISNDGTIFSFGLAL